MPTRLGRYEILAPIASGGMGTVYLARAVGAGGFERLVAIKALHPHVASDPDFVEMFLDEARLAARLRHPNAVATIDVQEQPLFLVMEYVEGPSLHRVLRQMRKLGGRIPLGIALRIFLDVTEGLHAAHELRGPDGALLHLVHRDVSPHNMLVGVDGVSRITDFGVARAESRLSSTRGDQVKGKLAYMAPEQVRSEPVDRRADVYAAGAVLWELLVGRPLVRGDNDGVMLAQVLEGPRASPRRLDPEIPQVLDDVCMRALQPDVAARFPTASELGAALEQAAASAGIAVATQRAVAAFVRELAIHAPPVAAAAPALGHPDVPALVASDPPSQGSVAGALVDSPPATRRAPRVGLALLAGAAGLAVGVAAFVTLRPREVTHAAPAAAPMLRTVDPVAAGDVAPPVAVASVASGAPTSSAAAPPTGSAMVATSPRPPDARRAPGAAAPPRGAVTGRSATPASSPTSFRPGDL